MSSYHLLYNLNTHSIDQSKLLRLLCAWLDGAQSSAIKRLKRVGIIWVQQVNVLIGNYNKCIR